MVNRLLLVSFALTLSACTSPKSKDASTPPSAPVAKSAFPSTYKPIASTPLVIRHATILTGTGTRLNDADVVVVDGKIQSIGANATAPAGARVLDAAGRWVTPGLIDVHSHLGVYASPGVNAHSDGNEMTGAGDRQVWAEHARVAAGSWVSNRARRRRDDACRSCRAPQISSAVVA